MQRRRVDLDAQEGGRLECGVISPLLQPGGLPQCDDVFSSGPIPTEATPAIDPPSVHSMPEVTWEINTTLDRSLPFDWSLNPIRDSITTNILAIYPHDSLQLQASPQLLRAVCPAGHGAAASTAKPPWSSSKCRLLSAFLFPWSTSASKTEDQNFSMTNLPVAISPFGLLCHPP